MFPNKINQISDPVHGSIQISELEKSIVSTQVFNRLHHILQNSTVYLTFPSNKTSRFAHSLGVMHLGGEMFRYSISNGGISPAGEDTVSEFLSHIDGYLDNLGKNKEFRDDIKEIIEGVGDYSENYKTLKSSDGFSEPFYTVNTPFCIPKDYYYSYIVSFQSLRCAALLHDLGHPPFSHITEDALENIFMYLQEVRKSRKLTERENNFINIIIEINHRGKLHEVLSKDLSEHIFNVLIKEVDNQDINVTKLKKIFYAHVMHTTLAILHDSDEVFKALHSILDGVIDCDRLDYVSRDPLASGFNDGTIEYDRLIKTMKLISCGKDQTGKSKFEFCPSSGALNTIEDFLKRRWKLYKYVINHHRVVKTDTLLKTVIEELAKEYLSKQDKDEALIDFRIPTDISGLWKTVDGQSNITDGDYINHLIQWDDAWLLACLRSEYFLRIKNKECSILVIRLEELLSNKKKYISLYKRLDGFEELDLAILENFNASILDPFDEDPRISHNVKMIKIYKEQQEVHPSVGLFANILDELFGNLGRNTLDEILNISIKKVAETYEIVDYIFKRNKLKTGLDGSAKIYYGDNLYPIESYSRISIELSDNKSIFPPYYIYLYSKNEIIESKFKLELGVQIAKQIEEFFVNLKGD